MVVIYYIFALHNMCKAPCWQKLSVYAEHLLRLAAAVRLAVCHVHSTINHVFLDGLRPFFLLLSTSYADAADR